MHPGNIVHCEIKGLNKNPNLLMNRLSIDKVNHLTENEFIDYLQPLLEPPVRFFSNAPRLFPFLSKAALTRFSAFTCCRSRLLAGEGKKKKKKSFKHSYQRKVGERSESTSEEVKSG